MFLLFYFLNMYRFLCRHDPALLSPHISFSNSHKKKNCLQEVYSCLISKTCINFILGPFCNSTAFLNQGLSVLISGHTHNVSIWRVNLVYFFFLFSVYKKNNIAGLNIACFSCVSILNFISPSVRACVCVHLYKCAIVSLVVKHQSIIISHTALPLSPVVSKIASGG